MKVTVAGVEWNLQVTQVKNAHGIHVTIALISPLKHRCDGKIYGCYALKGSDVDIQLIIANLDLTETVETHLQTCKLHIPYVLEQSDTTEDTIDEIKTADISPHMTHGTSPVVLCRSADM